MKSGSFVDIEDGIDEVERFDLDDSGEGEARYGRSMEHRDELRLAIASSGQLGLTTTTLG